MSSDRAIGLPWPLQVSLEAAARALLNPNDYHFDFLRPTSEAALMPADSVSWRVFKNPVSVFVGGVTAVIMELAEPRVRTGVWEHTTFRVNPIQRLRRTGLAAMMTIYGGYGLHPWEAEVVRRAGAFADRVVLDSNPAVQACRRMRLPVDYLYVHRRARIDYLNGGTRTSRLTSAPE